ncbi:DUF605-domain-containing protein [Melampsora americana]|nr:DUF605-domain-containing protein [Melampsora americana]
MSSLSLSDLPPSPIELKSIIPYLQRAREMEKVDPVITYWCSFHAAQTCMSIQPVEPESRTFLMKLLDYLEQKKASLSDHDAITNNLAATAYVENFALQIFDWFLAAACFLEVLTSLTNQPEADILEKIKYAKWKAASIVKAVREGPSQSQTLAGSSSLASKSTDRTPFDDASQMAPTTGSSSSPPLPPNVQSSDCLISNPSRMVIEPVIGVAPKHFPNQPSQTLISSHHPVSSPLNHSAPGLSSTTHPLPPPLPPPPQSVGTNVSKSSFGMMDPTLIGAIQKHAKYAISALNYEDVVTARSELLLALDKLALLS